MYLLNSMAAQHGVTPDALLGPTPMKTNMEPLTRAFHLVCGHLKFIAFPHVFSIRKMILQTQLQVERFGGLSCFRKNVFQSSNLFQAVPKQDKAKQRHRYPLDPFGHQTWQWKIPIFFCQFEFLLKPPCSSGFSVAWDC